MHSTEETVPWQTQGRRNRAVVGHWFELAVAGMSFVFGSFVAGAEAAVISLPEARLRALLDEVGPKRGRHLARYLADSTTVLTRLLTLRVMALILASVLCANALLPARAPVWQLALLTLGAALVYGAVAELGMTLGRTRGRSLASGALALVRPFEWLVAPVAAPLVAIGRAIRDKSSHRASDPTPITVREVEYVVEEAKSSGGLDGKRVQMLQNVLELNDLTTREVMVPRTKMTVIEASTPVTEILRTIAEDAHSRVPVYKSEMDNIVGVLHVKDLFRAMERSAAAGNSRSDVTIEEVARKHPYFVAPNQSILTVLREMQSRRTHMAMVLDEFGAVAGLVTLEDILEQLVGDIQDEHDSDEVSWLDQGNGRYLVSAAMSVNDVAEHLGVEFPDADDYSTLGGFVAARAGRVPGVGTVVRWDEFTFTVREGDARHATKVEIARTVPGKPDTAAAE